MSTSKTKTHTIEVHRKVWNDETGERIEVGPDADSVGLVDVVQYADDDSSSVRITGTPEMMRLVAKAILNAAYEIEQESET